MAVNRIRVSQIKAQSPDLSHFGEQLSGQGKPYYQLFHATAGQTLFTLAKPYEAGSGELKVFLNGMKLTASSESFTEDGDYHEASATSIEFFDGLEAGDLVEFLMEGKGQGVAMVVDHFHVYREKPAGKIDSINRVFYLSRTPKDKSEMIFRNGILLNMGIEEDYVIEKEKIIFNDAPPTGAKILVNYDVSYV